MPFKKLVILSLLLAAAFTTKAQKLLLINIDAVSTNSPVRSVEFKVGGIFVYVKSSGTVYIHPFGDSIYEYYSRYDGAHRKNKIKSLNNVVIDYYSSADGKNAGKIKSIGDVIIEYNGIYDGLDNIGKVKAIGNIKFAYYDRFDWDNNGKLKTIDSIPITYYDRFDWDNNGRVKSVGKTEITYTDRFDSQPKGTVKAVKNASPYINIIEHNTD